MKLQISTEVRKLLTEAIKKFVLLSKKHSSNLGCARDIEDYIEIANDKTYKAYVCESNSGKFKNYKLIIADYLEGEVILIAFRSTLTITEFSIYPIKICDIDTVVEQVMGNETSIPTVSPLLQYSYNNRKTPEDIKNVIVRLLDEKASIVSL